MPRRLGTPYVGANIAFLGKAHANSGFDRCGFAHLRGFSLIEMVVVMSMLAALLLVIAATLWGAVKIERADSAAFHRMTVQSQLADQFREDVARSIDCPDSVREFVAGPTCLVLKLADGQHIIYRWDKEHLKRFESSGSEESSKSMPVGGDGVTVAFARSGPKNAVILMRLIESRGAGSSRRDWTVEIGAALGGDRR